MPSRNGTGPVGLGSMTGRGLGSCLSASTVKYGAGLGQRLGLGFARRRGLGQRLGLGRGFGKGIIVNQNVPQTQKELLQEQKNVLKNQLDAINKHLENL